MLDGIDTADTYLINQPELLLTRKVSSDLIDIFDQGYSFLPYF